MSCFFLLDIDECLTNTTHNCHTYANCTNNNGSFSCTCMNGFTGDGTFCKGTISPPPVFHSND